MQRKMKQEMRIRSMGEGCYNCKYGSQRCFPKKVHLSKTSRRGRRCGDLREELSMQSEQQVQRP